MSHQIMKHYDGISKDLQSNFSEIKKYYYSPKQLFKEIDTVGLQIQKDFNQIKKQTQQLQRKKKLVNSSKSSKNKNFDDQFASICHIKQVKRPPNSNQQQLNQINQYEHFQQYLCNLKSFQPYSNYDKINQIKIYPNRQISINFYFKHIQPILPSQTIQSNQLFPQNFQLHLHHLDNHLKTQLNYNTIHGLTQIDQIIQSRNTLISSNKLHLTQYQLPKISTKAFTAKYIFRHSNLNMYRQLISNNSNQHLILSITNAKDKSGLIIAITKLNFKDLVFGKYNMADRSNTQQLIQKNQQITLYFRKILSFNQVCPLEELPLMFKMHANVQIKQEMISPPLQDLKQFFYPARSQQKRNSIKQSESKLLNRSPRKIIDKTPPRIFPKQEYPTPNNRSVSPLNKSPQPTSKSPHHKRIYVKSLIDQGYLQQNPSKNLQQKIEGYMSNRKSKSPISQQQMKRILKQDNKPKYQKIITLNSLQLQQNLNIRSAKDILNQKWFQGSLFSYIQNQMTPQHVEIIEGQNIDYKKCEIIPQFKFFNNNQTVNKGHFTNRQQDVVISDQFGYAQNQKFVLKLKIKIGLKDKNEEGKMLIYLPFVQKLNKLQNTIKGSQASPTRFQILIKPNFLFQIWDSDRIEEQERELKIMWMSHENDSSDKNQKSRYPKTLTSNKIIRLEDNMYMISEYLPKSHISRDNIRMQIQNGFICNFYFKPKIDPKLEIIEQPKFFVYPFGTIYKVRKAHNKGYFVSFKLNYKQYEYYAVIKQKQKQKPIQLGYGYQTNFAQEGQIVKTKKQLQQQKQKNNTITRPPVILQLALSCVLKVSSSKYKSKQTKQAIQTKQGKQVKQEKQAKQGRQTKKTKQGRQTEQVKQARQEKQTRQANEGQKSMSQFYLMTQVRYLQCCLSCSSKQKAPYIQIQPLQNYQVKMSNFAQQVLQQSLLNTSLVKSSINQPQLKRENRQNDTKRGPFYCNLNLQQFVKDKQQVYVHSSNELVNVVNGQRFDLWKNKNVILQVLSPLAVGSSICTMIFIDNWEQGKTSTLQVKIINRKKIDNKDKQKQMNRNKKQQYWATLNQKDKKQEQKQKEKQKSYKVLINLQSSKKQSNQQQI